MNRNISIQLKATFLIIVFSINTVIGFACALGIDMGFNTTHHHEEEATEAVVHIHKDGKKHVHQEAAKHHDEANNHKSKESKDDCCNDKVIKITQVDKSMPQSLKFVGTPVFFTTFISSFYNIDPLFTSQNVSNKYFVRSHHPPIQDIRIAIQSFQI